MAQTLVKINKNNLRYLLDLRYNDLSSNFLSHKSFFVGSKPDRFSMLTTMLIRNILCKDQLDSCSECLISSILNKYKGNELRI